MTSGEEKILIGCRLREERIKYGLSQAKFAKLAGVGPGAQKNYEAGRRSPDTKYLSAIKDDVDVTYILTGEKSSSEDVLIQMMVDAMRLAEEFGLAPESEQVRKLCKGLIQGNSDYKSMFSALQVLGLEPLIQKYTEEYLDEHQEDELVTGIIRDLGLISREDHERIFVYTRKLKYQGDLDGRGASFGTQRKICVTNIDSL